MTDTIKNFTNPNVSCPCCGVRTLRTGGTYEICGLCHWEDDGQDDWDADRAAFGPNGNLSLTEARRNFRETGSYNRGRPSYWFINYKGARM